MSETTTPRAPGAGENAPRRIVAISEIVEKRHEGIVAAVEEYVKTLTIRALEISMSKVSVLARLKLKLIRSAYMWEDWREIREIDLMGFSILEVRVSEVFSVDNDHVILYIELPNGRRYRITIDLYSVSDLLKDTYTRYVEEYNKIKAELEQLIEQEKKRREEEEVKRKLGEYERLKKENEELKKRIRELENELNELREKRGEEEESEGEE